MKLIINVLLTLQSLLIITLLLDKLNFPAEIWIFVCAILGMASLKSINMIEKEMKKLEDEGEK